MLQGELLTKLGQAVDRMPAFPRSVQSVLALTRRLDCEARDVVRAIEQDPVMTVKLLKVINSAYYAMPRQVAAVDQAVAMLGLNTVKNMALAFATSGMLPEHNDAGFDTGDYLAHSLATAELARVLAQRFPGVDASDAYVVGLLHDFGKIVFVRSMPGEFSEALALAQARGVPLDVAEREVMGADHTMAGGLLVERWQFPPEVCACIRQHHEAPGEAPLSRVLFAANQMARHLGGGHAGNPVVAPLPPQWGLGAHWDELALQAPQVGAAIEQARQFAGVSTGSGA